MFCCNLSHHTRSSRPIPCASGPRYSSVVDGCTFETAASVLSGWPISMCDDARSHTCFERTSRRAALEDKFCEDDRRSSTSSSSDKEVCGNPGFVLRKLMMTDRPWARPRFGAFSFSTSPAHKFAPVRTDCLHQAKVRKPLLYRVRKLQLELSVRAPSSSSLSAVWNAY
jgi:hypothetical protein